MGVCTSSCPCVLNKHTLLRAHRLVKRPSALPDFVTWMESVWNHLDGASTKREQMSAVFEQLEALHHKLMQVRVHCSILLA